MPHRNSFSQRDSDQNQFALWLPHCILVAILPSLFSLSFQFQPEAIVILRQRAWSLRSPQPEKSKMVQVGGLSKESYRDLGGKRHRDRHYIMKEKEAIFLSPPFPFLSFSFFFSTDLMTDNLVPKKSQNNLLTKFSASPTVVGRDNSLRFWESSSPAKTKKRWVNVDQSVIFARYWRDLLYHNVGVTISFLVVDPTAKEIFHWHVQVNWLWLASQFDTYMMLDVNLRVWRVLFVWITTIFAQLTILQYEKLADLWPASPGRCWECFRLQYV